MLNDAKMWSHYLQVSYVFKCLLEFYKSFGSQKRQYTKKSKKKK